MIWEEIWIPVKSAASKLHYFGFCRNLTICKKEGKNLYFCSLSGLENCIFGIENPVNRAIGKCHQIAGDNPKCLKTPCFVGFADVVELVYTRVSKTRSRLRMWVQMGLFFSNPISSPKTPILTNISRKSFPIASFGLHFCTMTEGANYKELHFCKGFLYKAKLPAGLLPEGSGE